MANAVGKKDKGIEIIAYYSRYMEEYTKAKNQPGVISVFFWVWRRRVREHGNTIFRYKFCRAF